MGMFDYVKYKDKIYQTKDTEDQGLILYEILDATLWKEESQYELSATSNSPSLKKVSSELIPQTDMDGAITFYDDHDCFTALFSEGKMLNIVQHNSTESSRD